MSHKSTCVRAMCRACRTNSNMTPPTHQNQIHEHSQLFRTTKMESCEVSLSIATGSSGTTLPLPTKGKLFNCCCRQPGSTIIHLSTTCLNQLSAAPLLATGMYRCSQVIFAQYTSCLCLSRFSEPQPCSDSKKKKE